MEESEKTQRLAIICLTIIAIGFGLLVYFIGTHTK